MIGAIIATSTTASTVLLPRVGPRLLVPPGMLIAAAGMVVLTQGGVHGTYAAHILPALIPLGVGIGLISVDTTVG